MSILAGNLTVSHGYKAVYSSSSNSAITGTLTTDVVALVGSATTTLRILRIGISGTKTTGGLSPIQLIKRSTANTGGSPSSFTLVGSYDSTNPAPVGLPVSYTAAPTLGNTVGIIRSTVINFPTTTPTGTEQNPYTWLFDGKSQELVIRGTSELVAINTAGTALTGALVGVYIEWTEE